MQHIHSMSAVNLWWLLQVSVLSIWDLPTEQNVKFCPPACSVVMDPGQIQSVNKVKSMGQKVKVNG